MYEIGDEELEAIRKLFDSKKLFRYQGKNVDSECRSFEKEFAKYNGSTQALILSSGTNALLCSLKAAGVGAGDEVLIPGFTFVATPAAVLQAGAKPVLVNIDEKLSMSVSDLKKHLTSRTRAIIPVHMDGLNCDMKSIMDFAREHKLIVIEDVAQAVGGSFEGKKLGTFGFSGCFSFNVDKIISCGEGGAIICNDENVFRKMLAYHDVGAAYGATFKDYLAGENITPGTSMRTSEISGAIMRVQLKRLDSILKGLRERKKIFSDAFTAAGLSFVSSHDPAGDCGTSFHFSVSDPMAAGELCKKLLPLGVKAMPTSGRPAHAYWHWIDLLGLDENEKKKVTTELAPSKLILSSNIKVFIELTKSVEETRRLAEVLAKEVKASSF